MTEADLVTVDGAAPAAAAADPAPAESRTQAELEAAERAELGAQGAPPWIYPLIRATIWRIIWVGLGMTVLVLSLLKALDLIGTLVIALFLSIAMDPAITSLNRKRGWRRGTATGVVFLVVLAAVVLMITVLIPALTQVAAAISASLPNWIKSLESTLGLSLRSDALRSSADIEAAVKQWLSSNADTVLGVAGSGVGVVFRVFTAAMFTFYFAADAPRIRRAFLVRLPPARQERLGWAWDTAIEQTGGYLYSRVVLLVINATLSFFVMIAVGVPWLVALPLAVFMGFFAEFIPVLGTYVGAAIPILVTLGLQGVIPAAILTVWILIYQQLENYWLSPKISARSMEINGGVAFGSALAGGAIAGPMGAFMAMPIAALITSFVSHYARKYPLVYQSSYDTHPPEGAPEAAVDAAPVAH